MILITGGAGYLGRRLAARPGSWRALVRDLARAKAALPASTELVQGDMTDPASLRAALKGVTAVIHLAARKNDEGDSEAVNVGGARNLVEACKAEGVKRVIAVGTQASRLPVTGVYGKSKADGDEIIRASGLDWTVIRPSLVYGPGDPGAFGKLARAVAAWPVVPVMGDGTATYRPVFLDDACAAIAGCVSAPRTIGKTYDLGGPETVTFAGLVDLIAAARGKTARKVFLPASVAMLLARTTPFLSVSNVLGGTQVTPEADWGALFRDLGLSARPIEQGMSDGHFL